MASNDTYSFQYLLTYLHEENSFQGLQRCSRLGQKPRRMPNILKRNYYNVVHKFVIACIYYWELSKSTTTPSLGHSLIKRCQ